MDWDSIIWITFQTLQNGLSYSLQWPNSQLLNPFNHSCWIITSPMLRKYVTLSKWFCTADSSKHGCQDGKSFLPLNSCSNMVLHCIVFAWPLKICRQEEFHHVHNTWWWYVKSMTSIMVCPLYICIPASYISNKITGLQPVLCRHWWSCQWVCCVLHHIDHNVVQIGLSKCFSR